VVPPAHWDKFGRDAPADAEDVDAWVARRLLNSASAMFREGHVLLSEENPPQGQTAQQAAAVSS
jgi:hypothetical protein